jgi:hypothetical protein
METAQIPETVVRSDLPEQPEITIQNTKEEVVRPDLPNLSKQSQDAIRNAQEGSVSKSERTVDDKTFSVVTPILPEGKRINPQKGVFYFEGFGQTREQPPVERMLGNIATETETTTYAHTRTGDDETEAIAAMRLIEEVGLKHLTIYSYSSGSGPAIKTIKWINAYNQTHTDTPITIDGIVFMAPVGLTRETTPLLDYLGNAGKDGKVKPNYPEIFSDETIADETALAKEDMSYFWKELPNLFRHPKRLVTEIQEGRERKGFNEEEEVPPVVIVLGENDFVSSPADILPSVDEQGNTYIQYPYSRRNQGLHHRETAAIRQEYLRSNFPNPDTPVRVIVMKKGDNHSGVFSYRMPDVIRGTDYLLKRLHREQTIKNVQARLHHLSQNGNIYEEVPDGVREQYRELLDVNVRPLVHQPPISPSLKNNLADLGIRYHSDGQAEQSSLTPEEKAIWEHYYRSATSDSAAFEVLKDEVQLNIERAALEAKQERHRQIQQPHTLHERNQQRTRVEELEKRLTRRIHGIGGVSGYGAEREKLVNLRTQVLEKYRTTSSTEAEAETKTRQLFDDVFQAIQNKTAESTSQESKVASFTQETTAKHITKAEPEDGNATEQNGAKRINETIGKIQRLMQIRVDPEEQEKVIEAREAMRLITPATGEPDTFLNQLNEQCVELIGQLQEELFDNKIVTL